MLPRPIAVKLCYMIGSWFNITTKVAKFVGPRDFLGAHTCKIRGDFGQLQNSIPNISGTDQDIKICFFLSVYLKLCKMIGKVLTKKIYVPKLGAIKIFWEESVFAPSADRRETLPNDVEIGDVL